MSMTFTGTDELNSEPIVSWNAGCFLRRRHIWWGRGPRHYSRNATGGDDGIRTISVHWCRRVIDGRRDTVIIEIAAAACGDLRAESLQEYFHKYLVVNRVTRGVEFEEHAPINVPAINNYIRAILFAHNVDCWHHGVDWSIIWLMNGRKTFYYKLNLFIDMRSRNFKTKI